MTSDNAKKKLLAMLSGPGAAFVMNGEAIKAVLDALEMAETRIAELEARDINIKRQAQALFEAIANPNDCYIPAYVRCLREALNGNSAGIGVKQQEDSVDSDVASRNQPGMVVAVHIDAGDFVKVKGQVFEVEETDFDDHDVTLWFVGGNALKCAAGCPVEVVSEPVAADIKVKG